MISAIKKADYAIRDRKGKVVFYVLLWKRKGISLELFDDYWRNVHGPVCARLPGQYQYWQFHLAHNEGGLWPTISGIKYTCPEEDQFDGIAELIFETEADRETWFKSAAILMDDEHNLFSKAIGYNTSPGNSQTYIDGIPTGDPNGQVGAIKFQAMVKKADGVSAEAFRKYMADSFAPAVIQSDSALKFRLHLFEQVDNSRPDAAGVAHYEPPDKQYQAAFEIAFANPLEMETLFASKEYASAVKDQATYVKQLLPFPERTAYTFVYDGKMTLAGQRSSTVAELITKIGATNQLKEDIVSLMNGKQKVKGLFAKAQGEYNMTNKTSFTVSDAKVPSLNSKQAGGTSERVYATFSSPVNASLSTVWNVLLDKIENPGRYNPEAQDYKILERHGNGVLREMKVLNMSIKERITWDEKTREIRHTLVHNPLFIGQAVNAIVQPESNNPNDPPIITYTVDWEPYNGEARHVAQEIQAKLAQAVQQTVLNSKTVAEQQDAQKESPFAVSNGKAEATTTNGSKRILERLPGTNVDMVKRLFSRGEAFDSDGFITFFTDTPVYQFGNSEVCLDKESIKKSVDNFFSRISALYHEIKMMWEEGDTVFVEMDVLYWRKDGSMVSLPCTDIFRLEGDKFSELRIFMDANPIFDPAIPVPKSASVLTVSQGKQLLPPDIMRKHFAEHPEGKKRVKQGFVPKWSIACPKWPIGSEQVANGKSLAQEEYNMTNKTSEEYNMTNKTSEQLKAVGELAQSVMAQDWEKMKTYLSDDLFYKVGSSDPVYGPQAVVDFFERTFKNTAVFYDHEARKIWQEPDIITVEMDAKYELVGSKKHVTIACCDVYRMRGNKVNEWRVYADLFPWYADTPPWQNGKSSEQLKAVGELAQSVMAQDWEKVKTYLSDDVFYKAGSSDPVYGPQAVVDFFKRTFKNTAVFYGHEARKVWQEPDIITVEMDAKYELVGSKKHVTIACCDVYRMRGNKVNEWRVYADVFPFYADKAPWETSDVSH